MPQRPRDEDDESDAEESVSFTVRWPVSVREAIKKQSKVEERTFNMVTVRAARAYLEATKKGAK